MLYNKIIHKNTLLDIYESTVDDQRINTEPSPVSFSEIYISYYSKLLRFAREYVVVNEDAENIIQDVFVKLWERQDSLHLIDNINAYLFRLVRNKCLDYLRHKLSTEKCNKSVQNTFEMELNLKIQSLDRFDETFVSEKNMEKIVSDAIDSLPNKCREIFLSSRIEGLKYREISERFNISVNTVENQMSIALKKLRIKLKDHLSV
ncbi:RNA polymerase sigma-70 factor (ECF subfamily) [Dysgonomonas hofstadii]|uniref:RNA polymerase sigma-70 factor (ECF subfamily) n=1 Tax=Dysgonomonas hofstadii TaxID=637886 RepID=A0A840CEF6_9BACT|nr:RNA polymerase sigma-70 factor (ECF subfamily) [Dysgonomonas hofstadii]